MPDNNTVKSKRDIAMERMRTKYPDRSFDDDEAFFGQINDDYDDYDKRIAESQSREEAFSNMFTSNPKSAPADDGMEKTATIRLQHLSEYTARTIYLPLSKTRKDLRTSNKQTKILPIK